MRRPIIAVIMALSLSGAARAAGAPQAAGAPAVPTITTNGEASTKHAPDEAWVDLETDAHGKQVADARRLGAQAMTDVQTALKTLGLAADAVRTLAFSIQPDLAWNNGQSTITGYVAHNQIEVRVDDLDKLPEVLDVVNSAKNVGVVVQGPRFDLKDRESIQRSLLAQAVQNALDRARAMAEGAHLTLGAVQAIVNDSAPTMSPQPIMRAMAVGGAAAAAPTPITPGDIELRAQVRLTIAVTAR